MLHPSSVRSFQVFAPATTGNARLETVNRLTGGTRTKTIGACRTKRPSDGKTAYWHERSKVRRCTSVKNSEGHQGDLIFNPLWNAQPWRVVSASVMQSADRRCVPCAFLAQQGKLQKVQICTERFLHVPNNYVIFTLSPPYDHDQRDIT